MFFFFFLLYLHSLWFLISLSWTPARHTAEWGPTSEWDTGHVSTQAHTPTHTNGGPNIYTNMPTTHTYILTHRHTHSQSAWDIHLGFVMSDMAHVSLSCNYGSIYFFRLSRWVRSVPLCGLNVETHSAQDIQLSRKMGSQYIDLKFVTHNSEI